MSQMKRGFTLIELLVVIAIIAILASLLFPVFARAREKARQTTCLSQQRQIATAALMYVQDNNGKFPGVEWVANTQDYLSSTKMLVCPSSNDTDGFVSYGYNGLLVKFDSLGVSEAMVKVPTEVGLTCDTAPTKQGTFGGLICGGAWIDIQQSTAAGGAVTPDPRHGKGLICSYTDGHAKYIPGGYDDKDLSNGVTRAFYLAGALGMVDNPAGGIPAQTTAVTAINATTVANPNIVIGGDTATQPLLTALAEIYKKVNGSNWFTRGFYGVNYKTGRPLNSDTATRWIWGDASESAQTGAPGGQAIVAYDAMVFIVAKNSKITTSGTAQFTNFDMQNGHWSDKWGTYVVNTAQIAALFGTDTGVTANTFTAYTLRRDRVAKSDSTLLQGGLIYFCKKIMGVANPNATNTGIGTQAIDCDSELDLVDKVANDPYGIGYCSSAAADPDRVLILAIDDYTVSAGVNSGVSVVNPTFVFPRKNVKYRWKMASTYPGSLPSTTDEAAYPYIRALSIGFSDGAGAGTLQDNMTGAAIPNAVRLLQNFYAGPLFRGSYWQP